MLKTATIWATSASLIATSLLIVPGPAAAQTYNTRADEKCWTAIVREARGRLAAGDIDQLSLNERQGAQIETIVYGTATADGRNFNYECTYNARTDQTYGLSVTSTGGGNYGDRGHSSPPPYQQPPEKKGSGAGGAVAGALIAGALIAAIASSGKKHNREQEDWWSPGPGVKCNNRESACYVNGQFSSYWTRRTY